MSAHATKAKSMLGRCGYAAGGATFLNHIRDGYDEGDWTNNLDRARPKRGHVDQGMSVKPSAGDRAMDRAMEDVESTEVLGGRGGEPLRRGPDSYRSGGKVKGR